MASKNKLVPSQGLAVLDKANVSNAGNGIVGQNAGQKDGVIFPSASRNAATYTSNPYFASDIRGLRLYFDLTNVGAGPGTVTTTVQIQDPVSGNWVALPGAVTSALNAVATTVFTVYPGQATVATTSINDAFTGFWRLSVVVGTNAVTFSIGGEYLG